MGYRERKSGLHIYDEDAKNGFEQRRPEHHYGQQDYEGLVVRKPGSGVEPVHQFRPLDKRRVCYHSNHGNDDRETKDVDYTVNQDKCQKQYASLAF
jgi:hypothetical protein